LLVEVTRDEGEAEDLPLSRVEAVAGTVGERDLIAYEAWWQNQFAADAPRRGLGLLIEAAGLVVLAAMLVGASLMALDEAFTAAQVGAAILALLGAFVGANGEAMLRRQTRLPPGFVGGLTLGLVAGAVVGAAMGALVLSYVGAIPGAIVGTLSAGVLARLGVHRPGSARLTIVGAWVGGMAYLFILHPWEAMWGSLRGLLAGGAVCLVAYLGFVAYMLMMFRDGGRSE
jgi:hypothetical protein